MSAVGMDLAVLGVGLWAEGLGTWNQARARWRGHAPTADLVLPAKPQTTLLPPAERRRAPATVLLALDVAEQACREAGLDARELRSVFVSAHGDLELTDYLCATLAESPELLSPTKFHHSVHNAASGYWTIGVGNRQASTALSAGSASFAQGLLEAAAQAVCEQAPVLLVAYDMPAPGPLLAITQSAALVGLALVLAPIDARADQAACTLSLRLDEAPLGTASGDDAACAAIVALLMRSPMACGLTLARALAVGSQQGAGQAALGFKLSPAQGLNVVVTPRNHGTRR